jgi:transposase
MRLDFPCARRFSRGRSSFGQARMASISDRTPVHNRRTLADRVKARVTEAGLALETNGGSKAAKAPKAAKSVAPAKPVKAKAAKGGRRASVANGDVEARREAQSLHRVYHELKVTYQKHRQQTGRPAVPALREAVDAYKRGPSLTSLVGVAAFLDDRGLLGW